MMTMTDLLARLGERNLENLHGFGVLVAHNVIFLTRQWPVFCGMAAKLDLSDFYLLVDI